MLDGDGTEEVVETLERAASVISAVNKILFRVNVSALFPKGFILLICEVAWLLWRSRCRSLLYPKQLRVVRLAFDKEATSAQKSVSCMRVEEGAIGCFGESGI